MMDGYIKVEISLELNSKIRRELKVILIMGTC